MAEPIYLVQGDTQPQFKIDFTRTDTGDAIDLTGASVRMYIRKKYETELTLEKTASELDPTGGSVVFYFSQGDLDIDAGIYEGEVEITYSNGDKETIYDTFDIYLREDFK